MSTKLLKVGVIGVGGIARAHMPGWAASPHAEVIAGADVSEDALTRWGDEWGVAERVTDAAMLLKDPSIDIVDICTPSMYHAPLTIAALEAGKHVICEKPLAPTPEDIRKIIAARDKAKKLVMTAQHFRYRPQSLALKAEIDAGMLGDIYHTRAWFLRRTQLPCGPGFILKKNSGGGPCIDIGVHILDTALWMMGHPKPLAVTGVSRNMLASQPGAFSDWGGEVPRIIDVEDFAAAFVRFDNGASLILETSWMLHHPTNEERLWLYGTQGGAVFPDCTLYTSDNTKKQRYDTTLTKLDAPHKPHAAECMDFAKAVAEGHEFSPVPPEQSLMVQSILDALYKSQEIGGEVKLGG